MPTLKGFEKVTEREVIVILEASTMAELDGMRVRSQAIEEARKAGYGQVGIDPSSGGSIPVDASGDPVIDPINQKVAGYIGRFRAMVAR